MCVQIFIVRLLFRASLIFNFSDFAFLDFSGCSTCRTFSDCQTIVVQVYVDVNVCALRLSDDAPRAFLLHSSTRALCFSYDFLRIAHEGHMLFLSVPYSVPTIALRSPYGRRAMLRAVFRAGGGGSSGPPRLFTDAFYRASYTENKCYA